MNNYIEDLTTIISDCSMENTYKMSWSRALVEHACNYPHKKEIHFDRISELMFKYYWDQTIFFNLEQGPNHNKRPVIYQIILNEIELFRKQNGQIPKKFIGLKYKFKKEIIDKISKKLTDDVSYRFQYINKKRYNIYQYKKGQSKKSLILNNPKLIKENHKILFQLINYRWTQHLENLNPGIPKIAQKVRGVDRDEVPKRKSLNKFKVFLDKENPDHKCFLTEEPIKDGELSIDHIIPWSYMYSDDLWNLVYVKKSENSGWSNKIKNQEIINKLIKRNSRLLEIFETQNIFNKEVDLLRLATERGGDQVKQFWIGSKAQG